VKGLLASSFLVDQKSSSTPCFVKDLKNLSIRSRRIKQRPTISGSLLRGRLCVNQGGYEEIKVGWIDVADGDDYVYRRRSKAKS
jgi:hypothetical protein